MPAVFRYVRWPRGGASCFPVRSREALTRALRALAGRFPSLRGGVSCLPLLAGWGPVITVAPRWCKLFSGTCGGPAVMQVVFRYVRWPRGGASCFPVRAAAPRWLQAVFQRPGTIWGASWGAFGASWSGCLIIFGIPTPSEAQFEPPGAIWAPLGASWGLPGAPPGAVWADPGPPGTSGGLAGTPLGAAWGLLGASWGLPPPPGEPQTRQKSTKF